MHLSRWEGRGWRVVIRLLKLVTSQFWDGDVVWRESILPTKCSKSKVRH